MNPKEQFEPEYAPLSDYLQEELIRRLRDHEANPQDVVPWDQVKVEALARMKKKRPIAW